MDQNDDEEVILVVRRSFIIELGWIIATVALLIFFVNFKELFFLVYKVRYDYPLITFLQFAFSLFIITFMLNKFFNWFYTVNIITNQRIVDIDFNQLGSRSLVEAQVKNIQSLTVKNTGFTSFLFGLSTLQILTAGDNPNIEFDNISDANKIYDLISDLTRENEKGSNK